MTDQRAGRMPAWDCDYAVVRSRTQPYPPTEDDMRRAAKIDGNQNEIVDALRAVGAHVTSLAAVGGGVVDLLCARAGVIALIEVKDGSLPPSERLLTPAQRRWHAELYAVGKVRAHVAYSVSDALAIVGCGPKAA